MFKLISLGALASMAPIPVQVVEHSTPIMVQDGSSQQKMGQIEEFIIPFVANDLKLNAEEQKLLFNRLNNNGDHEEFINIDGDLYKNNSAWQRARDDQKNLFTDDEVQVIFSKVYAHNGFERRRSNENAQNIRSDLDDEIKKYVQQHLENQIERIETSFQYSIDNKLSTQKEYLEQTIKELDQIKNHLKNDNVAPDDLKEIINNLSSMFNYNFTKNYLGSIKIDDAGKLEQASKEQLRDIMSQNFNVAVLRNINTEQLEKTIDLINSTKGAMDSLGFMKDAFTFTGGQKGAMISIGSFAAIIGIGLAILSLRLIKTKQQRGIKLLTGSSSISLLIGGFAIALMALI